MARLVFNYPAQETVLPLVSTLGLGMEVLLSRHILSVDILTFNTVITSCSYFGNILKKITNDDQKEDHQTPERGMGLNYRFRFESVWTMDSGHCGQCGHDGKEVEIGNFLPPC